MHDGCMHGGDLHMIAGLSVLDFSSIHSAVHINGGATVTLKRSTVARTSQTTSKGAPIVFSELSTAYEKYPNQDIVLRLEDVTFSENTADHDISATDFENTKALVYSNSKTTVFYNTDDLEFGWTASLHQAPEPRPGIDATTAWFALAAEV